MAGGSVDCYNHWGNSLALSKKMKTCIPYGPAFRYKHKKNGTYAPRNVYKNIHNSNICNSKNLRNNLEMFIHVRLDSDISHAIE